MGVYQIKNLRDSKIYVGSTVNNFGRRIYEHFYRLRTNIHHSKGLQKVFNEYGEDALSCSILEICDKPDVIAREQYWINTLMSYDPLVGYNTLKRAWNRGDFNLTQKTKDLLRIVGSTKRDTWRPVVQLDLEGNFIREWENMSKAEEAVGTYGSSTITLCIDKLNKSYKGFLWLSKTNYDPNKEYKYDCQHGVVKRKKIYQYTMEGILVKEWICLRDACRALNVDTSRLCHVLKRDHNPCYRGYKWFYNKISM